MYCMSYRYAQHIPAPGIGDRSSWLTLVVMDMYMSKPQSNAIPVFEKANSHSTVRLVISLLIT